MSVVLDGNKAKTARRVIEVLEFFDDQHREVTVMDIVRRYNRPQSSTSELLASLVELGLLYKEPGSRCYTLTPRAAILGSLSQPQLVRDGSLAMLVDRLVAQTGLGVALLGMVGVNAQLFRWTPGSKFMPRDPGDLLNGAQDPMYASAAGWLLLSSVKADRRQGVIRRLNAEAPEEQKFNQTEMVHLVQECGRLGNAIGPAGFGSSARMAAVLLPCEPGERPMALGLVHEPNDGIDPRALVALLQKSVQRCVAGTDGALPRFEVVSTAA